MAESVFDQSKIEPPTQIRTETHVFSNERDYYISRLEKHLKKLRRTLIIIMATSFADIAAIYLYPEIFKNMLNIFSVVLFLVWSSLSFCNFCRFYTQGTEIDIKSYKKVVFSIYITLIISLIILLNLFYIAVTKVIFEYYNWLSYFKSRGRINDLVLHLVCFGVYFSVNFIMPFMLVVRFSKIRKTLKSVGNLQGQEYSVTYTVAMPSASSQGLGLDGVSRKAEIR